MDFTIEESNLRTALGGRDGLFAFLRGKLGWDTDPEDTFTYDEPGVAGRVAARADVSRIPPFGANDPFVLFLVEFAAGFSRTDLREILRGVRAEIRTRAAFDAAQTDELIFVCATENYGGLRFAHFVERAGAQPRLRVFGFDAGSVGETATLRRENLPKLRLLRDAATNAPDWAACRGAWLEAWNVEAVTNTFFAQYERVFNAALQAITGFVGDAGAKRLFTQRLFNRLLFVHFLSKRGWLTFGGRSDYLFALWDGRERNEAFYQTHLKPLFLLGLNNPEAIRNITDNPAMRSLIGTVPFLNGGLFEESPEEKTNPGVVVPDAVIRTVLFELFQPFNFTIAESTPDDIEVAVDPEMLGKVFEKLILAADREAKGAFYTPRSVVMFMCEESVRGYLEAALPNPEKPDALERLLHRSDRNAVTVEEADTLLTALESLRVVDPACGSGAYLLGMMQTLFDLNQTLDSRARRANARDNYRLKLDIIRRNLFGVDLEAFAANIAMLRLWLSLIVDYRDTDVANVPPLPNLDLKIEVGDSLQAPSPRFDENLWRAADTREADALAALKEAHFHATDGTKRTLFEEIRARQQAMADAARDAGASPIAEGVFDWRIRFAEVFAQREGKPGGFGIVLANPPYGGTPVPPAIVERTFPRAAHGAMSNDLYGIFMARALELLAPGGQFCFVVSNTWRTIKSFKPLRKRLATQTTVRHVLDLPNWIFDATVNTGIVTLVNTPPGADARLVAGDLTGIERHDWHTLEGNLRLVAGRGADVQTTTYARYTYRQAVIGTYENYSFFIASPGLYGLMSNARFTKLGAIADVKVGLQTGDNEYYLRKAAGVRGSYRLLTEGDLLTGEEIAGLSAEEKRDGVDPQKYGGRFVVPYDKGGESDASGGWLPNYHVPTGYFIDWSMAAVTRLRTATLKEVKTRRDESHKIRPGDEARVASRFQNAPFYFKTGVTFSPTGIYSPSCRLGCGSIFGNKGSTIFSSVLSPEATLGFLSNRLSRYLLKNYSSHTVETGEEVLGQLPLVLTANEQRLF